MSKKSRSLIRIDPTPDGDQPYSIPDDNPFATDPEARPEIYAYGFRNPWRWSFDSNGDLYLGDVGQSFWEEIDYQQAGTPGGLNYGWRCKEGTHDYNFTGDCLTADLSDPIAEYDHDEGITIIGGFVYRGSSIPGLAGRYIFGDFSQFSESGVNNQGRLFFLNKKNIVKGDRIKTSKIFEFTLYGQDSLGRSLLGFGQDAHGELYVLANDVGTPFGDTGVVLRITRAP